MILFAALLVEMELLYGRPVRISDVARSTGHIVVPRFLGPSDVYHAIENPLIICGSRKYLW